MRPLMRILVVVLALYVAHCSASMSKLKLRVQEELFAPVGDDNKAANGTTTNVTAANATKPESPKDQAKDIANKEIEKIKKEQEVKKEKKAKQKAEAAKVVEKEEEKLKKEGEKKAGKEAVKEQADKLKNEKEANMTEAKHAAGREKADLGDKKRVDRELKAARRENIKVKKEVKKLNGRLRAPLSISGIKKEDLDGSVHRQFHDDLAHTEQLLRLHDNFEDQYKIDADRTKAVADKMKADDDFRKRKEGQIADKVVREQKEAAKEAKALKNKVDQEVKANITATAAAEANLDAKAKIDSLKVKASGNSTSAPTKLKTEDKKMDKLLQAGPDGKNATKAAAVAAVKPANATAAPGDGTNATKTFFFF